MGSRHLLARASGLAAGGLAASAAGLGLAVALPAPAQAASCSSADTGVTVVVDFNDLGGGEQVGCVAGGGGDTADQLFPDAGFPLTYAQQQPGFVCRVKAVPQSDPCQRTSPADAYWGLWWSKGDGAWHYSSQGVASLKVPDGGYVAFAWDDKSGSVQPALSPRHASSPSPSPKPSSSPRPTSSPTPTAGPAPSSSAPSTSAPATASPTSSSPSDDASTLADVKASRQARAEARQRLERRDRREARAQQAARERRREKRDAAAATPSASASPSSAPAIGTVSADPASASTSDGLPVWVAPVGAAVLLAAAGAVAVVRRRRSAG